MTTIRPSADDPAAPRVRCLRRVILRASYDGCLHSDQVRRACDAVEQGDDVVVVVKGRLSGPDPGVAGLLGRALCAARTISIEGTGPWIRMFAAAVADSAQLEAAS